jgi:hypothetical protein
LDAEYLRLRTLDGNFQTQMNYVESKLGQLEKCLTDRGRWGRETGNGGKMVGNGGKWWEMVGIDWEMVGMGGENAGE